MKNEVQVLSILMQGQDVVSVASGAVPLIVDCESLGVDHVVAVSWCVNFLRSGCPAAQIVKSNCLGKNIEHRKTEIEKTLSAVRIGKEHFSVTHGEANEEGHAVFTITRTETRNT